MDAGKFLGLGKRWRRWRRRVLPFPASWHRMPQEVRDALTSMYAREPQPASDGTAREIDEHTQIYRNKGAYLFELHERLRPERSVEVGLAYGYSTLYILAAMKNGDYGHHVAIDPYQARLWHGIGRLQAARIGLEERFTWVDGRSLDVLVSMEAVEERVQFVFIDGDHKFDSVLVDFTCAARVLDVGGYVVFDDVRTPSVEKAVSFVRRNRMDFVEERCPVRTLAAFRRVAPDERSWDHYARF